jgi:hypothetical protein
LVRRENGGGDDGALKEGRGGSRGSPDRRLDVVAVAGYSGEIPATEGSIEERKWSRRTRGERGASSCEEWRPGLAPFIAARGGRGGAEQVRGDDGDGGHAGLGE